ncbi:MAG: ABC transporter permease [Bryobacteraceae bacterium]
MLSAADTLSQTVGALRAYRMRSVLTILGLTMGVATIITVMTLIQGANLYVEQKIANLGTNVFQVSRVPFAVTDFTVIMRALRHRYLTLEDTAAVESACGRCERVGAQATVTSTIRYGNQEAADSNVIGQTAPMASIDTRTVAQGRFFTEPEDERATPVCLIGSGIVERLFTGLDPLGRVVRIGSQEYTVIGVYEKIGAILGQEQDNFAVIPMRSFVKLRGSRFSIVMQILAAPGEANFEAAQDQVRLLLRARRHIVPGEDEDFYIGTAQSYIELWKSISSAFFAVFLMVSGISAVVGGIVIMNVMLVSVTERTKEIGVRRAVGATQGDILRQFLSESLAQCFIGGMIGIGCGFLAALTLRTFTGFPASVQAWVAALGFFLSAGIGLFFGIVPAQRAARLDPVTALRSEK